MRAIRARFFYSAAVLIVCGTIYLLTKAFNLLNKPSDAAVFGGILIVLALFILVPSAIFWAWHHHVTPHESTFTVHVKEKQKDGPS
jgi:hypothetical protein